MLAGGMGSRMGGVDKGLVELCGKSLALRSIERIRPHVEEVVVTANRNLEVYSRFGCKVVTDGGGGPLCGLRAGLLAVSGTFFLTLPCDTPFFPENLTERLLERIGDSEIAVPASGGRTHHAFMLARKSLLEDLSGYLDAGGRKVIEWLERREIVRVEFEEENAFFNINTFEDLEKAQFIFSSVGTS